MKLETILNAMVKAKVSTADPRVIDYFHKRRRQYQAFRARILSMDAEKDKRIDVLRAEWDYLYDGSKELKAELDEKDKRIEEMQTIYTLERLLNSEEEQDD